MPSMPNLTVTGLVTVVPSFGSIMNTFAPGADGLAVESAIAVAGSSSAQMAAAIADFIQYLHCASEVLVLDLGCEAEGGKASRTRKEMYLDFLRAEGGILANGGYFNG